MYKIACAFACLIVSSSGAASATATRARLSDFPEARIDYYELSAGSAAALREEMDRVGPADPQTGKRHDAYTSYNYRWRLRSTPNGACEAEVRETYAVTFPRLSAASVLRGRDRQKWDAYLVALDEHEAGHLARAAAVLPALRRALASGTCENADSRARQVLDAMHARQRVFDEETRHGMRGGARFP